MSRFFIYRPIFATVIALIMLLAGGATMFTLPIAQFPTIVPPTVQVTAVYNGADAETVAQTVTSPLEQQINGVQGMLYMSSNSTSNGQSVITCTFEVGYDLNIAAVDVQNRAQQAFSQLPQEVQQEFVRTIPGLEDAVLLRPGYAVEYDFLCTDQLRGDLQIAGVAGLFAAGQINGTSGYEEAAGQGLMAGINAARYVRGEGSFVLDRATAYLGVMVDDLCRVNPTEPYRMFTSRAEFRLLLRSDNADRRLTPLAEQLGLLPTEFADIVRRKEARIRAARTILDTHRREGRTLTEWLRRPEVFADELLAGEPLLQPLSLDAADLAELEAEVKYEGYISRQQMEVDRLRRMEGKPFPADFDYAAVTGLCNEARTRLLARRPLTLGEASRIPGVRPADVQLLLVLLTRRDRGGETVSVTSAARP